MYIYDYLRVGFVSFLFSCFFAILIGVPISMIIFFPICFSIISKLKKAQIKHDMDVDLKNIDEHYKNDEKKVD